MRRNTRPRFAALVGFRRCIRQMTPDRPHAPPRPGSEVYLMPMTPANEHVDRPNTRPIHPGRAIEEGLPQSAHGFRVEAGRLDGFRVSHGSVNYLAETASQP